MRLIIVVIIVLLSICSNLMALDQDSIQVKEYSFLFSSLLDIDDGKYTFIAEDGEKYIDELEKFKALENVYIRNIEPDLANNKFSENRLKIVMFLSFYSYERNAAAFLEYLASDIMPIYINNSDAFLKILQELPFLIKANGYLINNYFGWEGENAEKKAGFIEQNDSLFKKYLQGTNYKTFIENFK